MQKRKFIFGSYDTAAHGWTLAPGWKLSDPEQKTNYVEKTGGDGSWDLSTAMTEGIPRYKDRSLTVTLECSTGTRASREELISEMVNQLDGFKWQIVSPDKPDHYLVGRLHVAVNYNDLAHAAVTVTGTCEPWLYSTQETVLTLNATSTKIKVMLSNNGRRAVVPTLTVTDSVLLEYGGDSLQLSTAGTYEWPALLLTPGNHLVNYSGSGTLTFTYREAVLR